MRDNVEGQFRRGKTLGNGSDQTAHLLRLQPLVPVVVVEGEATNLKVTWPEDLRYWSEYAGELQPVVQILALPETGASGASMLLSVLSSGTVGISTPLDEKYKADFYQMKLMCNGKEIVPLIRNKTEIVRELKNYYKERKRYTYAGVYSYPYEVFAPGQCTQMQVQVFSEEDIETPVTSDVPEATKNRIWADFKDFRSNQIASNKN